MLRILFIALALLVVEAKCEAGGMKPALEFCSVKRIACLMEPAATSS